MMMLGLKRRVEIIEVLLMMTPLFIVFGAFDGPWARPSHKD